MTRSLRLLCGTLAVVVAFAGVAIPANAQSPAATDLMAEANARYDREEYAEAVLLYESLVGDGYHDVALYYNLGNAHLGDGDLGRAILSYLRARELSPRDPDVRANLELARESTVDRIVAERGSLPESASYVGLQWVNRGDLGVVALALWTGVRPCNWWAADLEGLSNEGSGARLRGPRGSCHAWVVSDVPQHAVRKSVQQHGCRDRRCRGGCERPRMAVLGGVHHPQRRAGAHERLTERLGQGIAARRGTSGLGAGLRTHSCGAG